MLSEAEFELEVSLDDCVRFANCSGDWNPLHTDPAHAVNSVYGRQVLHGAFSAGLISRLAGMYLPGKDCLLFGMRLRFVAPILPPASLLVCGRLVSSSNGVGRVEASVCNKATGVLYVDASYEFGRHRMVVPASIELGKTVKVAGAPIVLVTGASGGLGGGLLRQLGGRGQAIARSASSERLELDELTRILDGREIEAIVHCAWPAPDNRRFIDLDNPDRAIAEHIGGPLRDVQLLADLIARRGVDSAPLVLIGSTFARPGRHYFRMPLYSIAKSMIPTMVDVLAMELASKSKRCLGVVFDVLDGGMNKGMGAAAMQANADRSPWGELATTDEAAAQIIWLLENQSKLISGATLTLSAGSVP